MDIEEISIKTFLERHSSDGGIVLLGTGGDLREWLDGVTAMLIEKDVAIGSTPNDLWSHCYVLDADRDCTKMILTLNPHATIDIGRLAIWRLQFGECMWISDYIANPCVPVSHSNIVFPVLIPYPTNPPLSSGVSHVFQ